jgi:hypothetical protein
MFTVLWRDGSGWENVVSGDKVQFCPKCELTFDSPGHEFIRGLERGSPAVLVSLEEKKTVYQGGCAYVMNPEGKTVAVYQAFLKKKA